MAHDYKEGPYSTGTLIERLENMCGRGEDYGILKGRDVWPDDVIEAIERIKLLEAANLKQSCIKIDDQMRIEKLEVALREIGNGPTCCPVSNAMRSIARKALEGKDE